MANILASLSGDWHTGSNWTDGVVPGVGDTAVLNGKTMTMQPGTTITCDKITNSTALGAANGRLNLAIGAASALDFTLNAVLESTGTGTVDMIQLSSTGVTNKTITVNVNGNITNDGSSGQTVLYVNTGTSQPCVVNINHTGDAITGGSANNLYCTRVNSTYATGTYTQVGNIYQTGIGAQSTVNLSMSVGGMSVDVDGYVSCGYNTTSGLLHISSNATTPTIRVRGGIRPYGTGVGVSIDNCGLCTIDAHSSGVAIEPGQSSKALVLGAGQADIVINGDVLGGTTSAALAISNSASTTSKRTVTVNGDMTCVGLGRLWSGGGWIALTVNGSIDTSAFSYSSSTTSYPVDMPTFSGVGTKLHVTGDVIGPNGGYAGNAGVYLTPTTTGLDLLRVDGTVYGGRSGPAIDGAVTAIGVNCLAAQFNNLQGCPFPPGARPYPAIDMLNFATIDILGVLDFTNGSSPIGACSHVRLSDTSSIQYTDTNNVAQTANLIAATSAVPGAADVRSGVATGSTVGTLVVPAANLVFAGTVYDNGTVGTLDLPAGLVADVIAIKIKTNQLTFTGSGVVADASGAATDYTARFNTIDTSLTAANTAIAGVKAKTDQLAFTVSGVVADAGGADYTTRFNSLDAAIAGIPTLTYTTRFNSIDDDLAALVTGGGVDFTPVLNAISGVDTKVTTGNNTTSAIKTKTDQLVFTANGVTADVSVSVSQVINYDARFDALDLAVNTVKGKTNQLTFGASGVNATASVDTAPIAAAVNTAIAPVANAVANLDADLVTHDTQIKAQLTTIQNATGAIDLTPITTSLNTINANVLGIPTINYTTRFNAIDAALSSVAGDVVVDLSPVLTAVAGVQVAVGGVQADTDAIQLAVSSMSVDLSPVTTAVAGVQTTANAIKAKTDTIAPCDTTGVADAINALEARFESVPSGPVALLPAPPAGRSTLVAYVVNHDGSPRVGQEVTVYVQQASGAGTLVAGNGVVLTSDAEGRVATTVPRGPQYVYAVHNGSRAERVAGRDADVIELPSMIIRV